ncbi:rho GTPase-activating protein 6-like [Pristis pectinata]|uniref:rho GTPase-activating protein 6-like n=1 Tax=Pristis pectinata TaxID=685728 RepID=UPI00223D6A1F|nr:rho GTPase-activating protein 6-like [Pristis pectinata]
MFGQSVTLQPVPIQSLSELERARLQEVAFYHLQRKDLGCQITIPKDGPKRKKSFRRKKEPFSKEKKDKELHPLGFGIPLSQVILNDCARKKKQDEVKEGRRDCLDLETSVLRFRAKKQHKHLDDSNVFLQSAAVNEPLSPTFLDNISRGHRRGAVSVDSITDLDDNQSRLLEALQLSLPVELEKKKLTKTKKKLSLNPIYRQVPRIVQQCCHHIESYGLQTVGIFRVGSSKKRVRQLRDEFDQGLEVILDEEHSVHDVAALLKEFLRDMPDPLLTRELYTAFINTMSMNQKKQFSTLQLLIYLLPPCNCDTLFRLLELLSKVASHAHDSVGEDGQEVTGNKMTVPNLATIFGPNLLHRENVSDKDYSMQAVEVEESSAVIGVIQKMIDNYKNLFLVAPDLQNEVLMSLMQTDKDVVHYLLRRKLKCQSGSDQGNEAFVMAEHPSAKSACDSCSQSNDVTPMNISPSFCESPSLQDQRKKSSDSELYKVPGALAFIRHAHPDDGKVFFPRLLKNPCEESGENRTFNQRRASRSYENLTMPTHSQPMVAVVKKAESTSLIPTNKSPQISSVTDCQLEHHNNYKFSSLNCMRLFTSSTEELRNSKGSARLRRVSSELSPKHKNLMMQSCAAKMDRDLKDFSEAASSSDNEYLKKKQMIESSFIPRVSERSAALQNEACRGGIEAKVWVKRDNGDDSLNKGLRQQQLQHHNFRSDQKQNSLRETAV